MMNRNLYKFIVLFSAVLFMNCSGKSNRSEDSQIRIFNATGNDIKIGLNSGSKGAHSFKVKSLSDTEYNTVSPANYDIEIASGSKKLLKKKVALAKAEKYSLIFYGRPDLLDTVNQATFSYKMHRIFEGEENYTKNGYLPGYKVFSDKSDLKKGYSWIRVINAASGFSPVSIKLRENGKKKKLVSGLAYPKPMKGKTLKSGNKTVELYLKSSPSPVFSKDFEFESKKVYIIIVFNDGEKLNFKILENEGKSGKSSGK